MRKILAAIFLTALMAAGCAGKRDLSDIPPDELYQRAQTAIEDYDFDEAQEYLDQIRDAYPFSKYAVEAELLAADKAYKEEKFEEAAAAYRSFEELHPTHPRVPYAIFRRGMAYMEVSHPADRDQTATRNAAEAFQKLLNAHPDSTYSEEARKSLTEARDKLAAHELYVARYYLRRKNYEAAITRVQELIQSYPDASSRDEALALALELQEKIQKSEQPN